MAKPPEGADGELGAVDAGSQIPGDGGNGGQIHVHREGSQARQGTEQDEEETGERELAWGIGYREVVGWAGLRGRC